MPANRLQDTLPDPQAADTVQDKYQVIGAPDTTADNVESSPIGSAYVTGTVIHPVIGGGVPPGP
jgi:hypothetical protein